MAAALRTLDAISTLLFYLACLLVVAIVCMVTYDVFSRNLGLPTAIWAVNAVEYAMLHITCLSIPYLVLTRGHVCVEIVLTYLPGGLRRTWETVLHVLAAAICAFLCFESGKMFLQVLADGSYEVRSFDAPMWTLYISMPLGFGFGALQFLAFLARGDSFYGAAPETHAGM
ncbi:TRAP transporter small permease [Paracoccus fontiphilus]|uniref:TRAP transporter small permease protein n=1 Tax=Paracoccus fontiphilus TaxID=1815556 RepID=A0ABV7ICZ9_9RHOB|nr:TRAP transporter small permease subunit [Paracoccus fontiphilus]